jgi:lambda family phage minor tail protein L
MNEEAHGKLLTEIDKSSPPAEVELFELDLRNLDGESILYFHNGTNGMTVPVSFGGIVYDPLPIVIRGIEWNGGDEPSRPSLTIANPGGFMSALVINLQDLVGGTLIRRRTLTIFLDGQPEAADIQFPIDLFRVERKVSEDDMFVEFELGTPLDLDGVEYPLRSVNANYCGATYRGRGCEFAENFVVTDKQGKALAGADRMTGYWSANTTYNTNDSVTFSDGTYYGVYSRISSGAITGAANGPLNTGHWQRVQRFRGKYVPANTYAIGDVVFIERSVRNDYGDIVAGANMVRTYCIAHTIGLDGTMPSPPNASAWHSDVCGKFLNHCRLRFDPRSKGNTLKFNGFPGTMNLRVSSLQ